MKNVAENLAITIVALIVGVFIGFTVSIKTTERIVASQETIIREAIRKETTAINNTVTNSFRKIKGKKSEPINIVIKPETNSAIQNNEIEVDSIKQINSENKKGFFNRVFSGDKQKRAERRAKREKRRQNN